MKTELLHIESVSDHEAIRRAGKLLREGAIVAFPTETVYGLGAKADKAVLERLDRIKNRTLGKRYTLHIGCLEDLKQYIPRPSLQARKLMLNTWPGPVTIIFEPDSQSLERIRSTLSPETFELLYSDGTLGVRCPDNPVTGAILSSALAPVIAPSANPNAQPPALSAQETACYFDGRIEMIVDAPGGCKYRQASTVVKVGRHGLEVLREGVLSRNDILAAGTINILFICTGNTCRSPMAEALTRKYLADKMGCGLDRTAEYGYNIASAGVAAFDGMPASSHAAAICRQKNSSLERHRSRSATERMIRDADVIFGMNQSHLQAVVGIVPEAAEKCYLLDASGPVADPAGYDIDVYRACAEQIERCLQERMNELL